MSKRQKTLFQAWSRNPSLLANDCVAGFSGDNDDFQTYSAIRSSDAENTNLVTDGDCRGFDLVAGETWIYPTNLPLREYQFTIVKECMFKNTMVVLPTGLGKTFIAAVVMFNLYRWYPKGKVIFMAPTRPLVAQQLEACMKYTGVPEDDIAQMTGTNIAKDRKLTWIRKRVFFLTPQILANDLARNICPAIRIKCLVIDEAHKAIGNHAYCEVIRQLMTFTTKFRVLALTATPGSDTNAVKQVMENLLIAHVELRNEDSPDIIPYTHSRDKVKIVIPLGQELTSLKCQFLDIINLYLKRLINNKALPPKNPANLSKFGIFKLKENYVKMAESTGGYTSGLVIADFSLCISLYHAYELMINHGVKSFYSFLNGVLEGEKSIPHARQELRKNQDFEQMMQFLKEKYIDDNVLPDNETSNVDPNVATLPKKFVPGHPKLIQLQKIVLEHFKKENVDATRVIIFSQYRDSVKEIEDMLSRHAPAIRVMSFIGQNSKSGGTAGITQKQQLEVMEKFRSGGYNTLVATCVGEEGLDIGEVDLIVCFDCPKSPIRLVQRMGRTGRLRQGRIVFLVAEGKEEQMYNSSEYQKKSIFKSISNGFSFAQFYQNNPRLVPETINPRCIQMPIECKPKTAVARKGSKANRKKPFSLTPQEIAYDEMHFKVPLSEIPVLSKSRFVTITRQSRPQEITERLDADMQPTLSLSKRVRSIRFLQETYVVPHSVKTKILTQTLQQIHNPSSLDITDVKNMPKKKTCMKNSKRKVQSSIQKSFATSMNLCESKMIATAITFTQFPFERISQEENEFDTLFESPVKPDNFFDDRKLDLKSGPCGSPDLSLSDCDKVDVMELSKKTNLLELYSRLFGKFSNILVSDFKKITKPQIELKSNEEQMPKLEKKNDNPSYFEHKTCTKLDNMASYDMNNSKISSPIFPSVFSTEESERTIKSPFEFEKVQLQPNKLFPEKFGSQITFSESPEFPEIKCEVGDSSNSSQYCATQLASYVDHPPTMDYMAEDIIEKVEHEMIENIEESFLTLPCTETEVGPTPHQSKQLDNVIGNFNISNCIKKSSKTIPMGETDCKDSASLLDSTDITFGSFLCNTNQTSTNSVKEPIKEDKAFTKICSPVKSEPLNLDIAFEIDFSQEYVSSNPEILPVTTEDVRFIAEVKHTAEFPVICTKAKNGVEPDSLEDFVSSNSKDLIQNTDKNIEEIEKKKTHVITPSQSNAPSNKGSQALEIIELKLKTNAPKSVSKSKKRSKTKQSKPTSTVQRSVLPAINADDDADFDFKKPKKSKTVQPDSKVKLVHPAKPTVLQKIEKQKVLDHFIIQEAVVSDTNCSSDETEDSDLDQMDCSFIDDQTSKENNHSLYLKSIKDFPSKAQGYKLKNNNLPVNVYSQPDPDSQQDYILDSFCVDDDNCIDLCSPSSEEEIVSKERNPKTRKKHKRIRVVVSSSSSSEEQTKESENEQSETDLNCEKDPRKDTKCSSSTRAQPNVSVSLFDSQLLEDASDFHEDDASFGVDFHLSQKEQTNSEPPLTISKEIQCTTLHTSSKLLEKSCKAVNETKSPTNELLNPDSRKLTESNSANRNESVTNPLPNLPSSSTSSSDSKLSEFDLSQPLTILANTGELATGKLVLTTLRVAFKAETSVLNLLTTDYIVSSRVAVIRIRDSEFTNASSVSAMTEKIKVMKEMYEKCCVIIEKDSRKDSPNLIKRQTRYKELSMIVLQNSSIKMLFSDSLENTAKILHKLAFHERTRDMHINIPMNMSEEQQKIYGFLITLPYINPIVAMNILHKFNTIADFLKCSPQDLKKATFISSDKAYKICWYLKTEFMI